MNNSRRKELGSIAIKLDALEDLLNEIKEAIESARDEEQDYFDNMPESLQGGDRGTAAEEAISNLEDAVSMLDDLDIDSLRGSIETAAE